MWDPVAAGPWYQKVQTLEREVYEKTILFLENFITFFPKI